MKKQLIIDIAKSLTSYGYQAYIAESGEYGFYTDGVRVVCFGGSWSFCVSYSGNYKTNYQGTGKGWRIASDKGVITEDEAREYITERAPEWAVRGASFVDYTTAEQYLAMYQSSSRFVLFEGA